MSGFLKYPKFVIHHKVAKIKLKYGRKKFLAYFENYFENFQNKVGFEVGGPSAIFTEIFLPIYSLANRIDGCNFSSNTIWEGKIESSDYKYLGNKLGKQYIAEGSDLFMIADKSYDFVLSSHNLEHIANPIKALIEWKRILKPEGTLVLILPDKRYTFDRNRKITSFSHLVEDFSNKIDEKDLTHLAEVLEKHDLSFDPPLKKNKEFLLDRALLNHENRSLHHHVFELPLIQEIFEHIGFEVSGSILIPPHHQVFMGKIKW